MRPLLAAFLLALTGSAALAGPDRSLRPIARAPLISMPDSLPDIAPLDLPQDVNGLGLRPVPRQPVLDIVAALQGRPPVTSLRPEKRATRVFRATPSARQPSNQTGRAVCGRRDILGEVIGKVPGQRRGCGIDDAVRVTTVSGVRLSTPALMNCRTAKALNQWVDRGLKRSVGNRGGGVVSMTVVGHYVCRTRNHKPGAPISEHGKGNAIDLSAFTLADGSQISVLKHWNSGSAGRILRRMHRRACGPFGTVIGPDGDRYHKDHFHFDTARNNYCK
jgi:hypothetical protein